MTIKNCKLADKADKVAKTAKVAKADKAATKGEILKGEKTLKSVSRCLQLLEGQGIENSKVNRCADVCVGDMIAFYSHDEDDIIKAEVVGVPLNANLKILVYRPFDRVSVGTLRLDKFDVYKIKEAHD
ncbi:MAG: hypothetical protein HQK49_09355 [Oligoflexia bacterium]|nr:hypothetical protein [Oligoflexia bacterium]